MAKNDKIRTRMDLKKFLVVMVMSVVFTMVLAGPTTRIMTAPQNQTNQTSAHGVVNYSGVLPGLRMLRMTGFQLQIMMIYYSAKTASSMLLQKYPFINKPWLNPPINLMYLMNVPPKARFCPDKSLNYKLAILHPQFATFQGPINLVYKYELKQSPQNAKLVQELLSIKKNVDEVVARFRKAYPHNMTIPMGRNLSESELDGQSKRILTMLQSRTNVAPTPTNIKTYRNFVIVKVLVEAIKRIDPCIPRNGH